MAWQPLSRCLQPRLMGSHIHPDVGWRRPPWVSSSGSSPRHRAPIPPGPRPERARQGLSTRTQSRVRAHGRPWGLGAAARRRARGCVHTQEAGCWHATVIHARGGDACLEHPVLALRSPAPPSKRTHERWMGTSGGWGTGHRALDCGRTRGNHTSHMLTEVFVKCCVAREKPQCDR